jgi:hypothetical protein
LVLVDRDEVILKEFETGYWKCFDIELFLGQQL